MKIEIVAFNELSTDTLYEILRLRNEVFVLEQNCAYQDVDGKDRKAIHVLGWKNNTLIAYARCFAPGDYFNEAAIGRILIKENFRHKGFGHQITEAAIDASIKNFKIDRIKISAQTYLMDFYQDHGFQAIGESYLEDDIPHIAMIRG